MRKGCNDMEKSNVPKPKIYGTLYITIQSDINMDPPLSNDKKCYKETIFISKTSLQYTRIDETIHVNSERIDEASFENSTLVRDTKTYTYPIDDEGELAALRDEFKTGAFSENIYMSLNKKEGYLKIKMTERMVPSEQLFHFEVDHPYLLLALWGKICRLSGRIAHSVFPFFAEYYTQKIKRKIRNERYYHDLILAIANSDNAKDDLEMVCSRLEDNVVTNRYSSIIDLDELDKTNCIFFDKDGVYVCPEDGKDCCVLVLSPNTILDFLVKYRDCFSDLDKLSALLEKYPENEDIPLNDETMFVDLFLQDVSTFASFYQLTDYKSISILENDKNHRFDPQDRPVLDLFYVLLTVCRIGHWAYHPIREVLEFICRNYKEHLLISIHDVINRILDVQTQKKYYKIDFSLYCCYHETAYIYSFKGEWTKCDYTEEIADRLVGFDPSEPEGSPYRFGNPSVMEEIVEISESEAINRFGLEPVIQSLNIF